MKKIISLTIALLMIISNVAFADDFENIKHDLTKYNIITDYEIGTINRAEAAKIIVTMMGIGECERENTIFTDVTKEYWASGYINRAQEMGIINGHGDGTFKPEQKLTNEQFIKMLVCALGYEPATTGVYPTGYFMKATQIGITNTLDLTGTNVALRKDVAVMVHNALDIPLMLQTSFGDYTEYVIADGKADTEKITLRTRLDANMPDSEADDEQNTSSNFTGEEYVGRILKISNIQKKNGTYTFKNSLNENDNAKYIVNDDTYVQITSNTVDIAEIKNGMYAQVWHYANDKDEIEILKIELMKNKPSGI